MHTFKSPKVTAIKQLAATKADAEAVYLKHGSRRGPSDFRREVGSKRKLDEPDTRQLTLRQLFSVCVHTHVFVYARV